MAEAEKDGLIGVMTGMFEVTSSGLVSDSIWIHRITVIFKSKERFNNDAPSSFYLCPIGDEKGRGYYYVGG